MTVAALVTSIDVAPGCPFEFTRRISGLASHRGTQQGEPTGNGSGSSTPGSRNGRATPVMTPKKTPVLVEIAFASLRDPSVGPTTVSELTDTRMCSYFSSCNKSP